MLDSLDLPTLISALSDPQAYPHEVWNLHVIQTHASCVFLTGEYVYKVKKPVNFSFLDYSSLEKRLACCERELVLNRRLCPEVYLAIVSIGWQGGRLRLGTSGVPVEYAVQMRQLPEEDLLPARLSAGTATAAHLRQIAQTLSLFHEQAVTGPGVTEYGAPEAIAQNVEGNFTQTKLRTGEILPLEHLLAVQEYSRRFLTEQRELFLTRMREGHIRDGHGDLRAQNLCLHAGLGDGIQILDCIEFSDRFRIGDVAADLAYLAMDLDLAGRSDFRRVLVNQYVQTSSDAELLRVLPFYQCYRAYVRGKIAMLAAEEEEIPPAERSQHLELAAAAFDLSRSYTQQRAAPVLLITVGYSGSGKSVLAREVVRRLPAIRLTTDEIRKELAGLSATSRLSADQYRNANRQQVYQELYRRAKEGLMQGMNVLLDATFLSAEERERAATLARDAGAEFWTLECRCSDAVIRRRLQVRSQQNTDPSDADVAIYETQRQNYELLDSAVERSQPNGRWLSLDTEQPVHRLVRQFLHAFWEGPGTAPLIP